MKLCLSALALGVCVAVYGQQPVITSFSGNGILVCTNLQTGTVASVEWASSLSGPWNNWAGTAGLDAVTVAGNGTITVSVPMFYRVRGTVFTTNTVSTTNTTTSDGMALIPAGSFTVGDTLYDEFDAIPTSVTVSAFYMDTNLVSLSQWQTVYTYATNRSYALYQSTYNGFYVAGGKAANHPVETVDWYDCVKWSNARSQQAGLTPVYYTDAGFTQVYTNGDDGTTVYANWGANGYRLPTEAEWEKAARGGLSGQRFPWGNTISESQANYYGDTADYSYDLGPNGYNTNYNIGDYPYTSPVGSFAPNGYGLYDMAGNVWEWCWDWYGIPYGQPTTDNPTGPATGGYRVLRGGYWDNHAYYARCAARGYVNPDGATYFVGVRCVRGL